MTVKAIFKNNRSYAVRLNKDHVEKYIKKHGSEIDVIEHEDGFLLKPPEKKEG